MKHLNNNPMFSFFKAPIKNTQPEKEMNLKEVYDLIVGTKYQAITGKIVAPSNKEKIKSIKAKQLDYVCFSGVFSKRSNQCLNSYSGLMVLDFDDLQNVETVAQRIREDEYIDLRLMFNSPSGKGVKLIVQTNGKKEDHLSYFRAYQNYFNSKYALEIDKSGKDLARACFLCHDPNAIYIEELGTLKFPYMEYDSADNVDTPPSEQLHDYLKRAVDIIHEKKIDITADYNDWITSGFALVDQFGEQGREVFHQISSNHPEYDFQKTNEQYDHLLSAKGQGITIKSLFYLFKKNKLRIKPPKIKVNSVTNNKLEDIERWLTERFEFRYNELRGNIELKAIEPANSKYTLINDRLFNTILIDIKRAGLSCSNDLLSGLINSDFSKPYHPFKAYISSLPDWDGEDHISNLAKSIKAENQGFWEYSFKKWFVGFVASLLDPKKINQQVVVLCGEQGIGKTTWILNLIPEEFQEYVFTGTINPSNKDSITMLAEMILINLDEMENMNRSDTGTLKSLITTQQVTLRKAYGKFNETRPRIASFIGSVNDRQFLNDPTGSRRFLVIDALEIDYKNQFDLGQVYQQAVYLFESGFTYYFEPDEIAMIERNNGTFQKTSLEEELLLKYFEPVAWDKSDDFRTATEILQYFNSHSNMRLIQSHANQVGKVLAKHGFEKNKHEGVYKWAVRFKRS